MYICGGVGGIKMVIREDYLSKLISFKDKDVIKVVTGVRRCGKSTLFLQYIDWLKTAGVADADIILINFDWQSSSSRDGLEKPPRNLSGDSGNQDNKHVPKYHR